MSEPAIYLGPSLDLAVAKTFLHATFLPPIRRGDLAKLGDEIEIVGIVDGNFFQDLSVSTMEIVALLDRGIRVFGASSIGALRAVETNIYGMIGVGEIYQWFRDGLVDADDEVALTYDPLTYQQTSEALINIRFALRDAVVAHQIEETRAAEVIEEIRKIYFPFRSFEIVYQLCPGVAQFIKTRQSNRKRDDAKLLLQTIANTIREGQEVVPLRSRSS